MGEWLTVGGVIVVWVLAIAVVVGFRLNHAHADLRHTYAELAGTLQQRHGVARGMAEALAGHSARTAIAELVSDAAAALDSSDGMWSAGRASAERNLDTALREAGDLVDHDVRLGNDDRVVALRVRLDELHDEIVRLERAYGTQADSVARQLAGWPARWVARALRIFR